MQGSKDFSPHLNQLGAAVLMAKKRVQKEGQMVEISCLKYLDILRAKYLDILRARNRDILFGHEVGIRDPSVPRNDKTGALAKIERKTMQNECSGAKPRGSGPENRL